MRHGRDRDPVEERVERIDQIASGVEMAADALEEGMKGLRRESKEVAAALRDRAASRVPGGEGDGAGEAGPAPGGDVAGDLSRCVDALEELHYRLLQIEVHPEVQSEEERERAADRAREAVEGAREVAESLAATKAA